ncbi:MAG: hypothetical protein RSE96_11935, partial [Niameybacter sp.]
LAKENAPLPIGLPAYKQCYYISARGLYQQYAKGEITLERARLEKKELLSAYKEGEWEWSYFLKLHELKGHLQQLSQDSFNSVLEYEILEMIETLLK